MDKKKTDEKEIRKAFRNMRQWLGLTQIVLAKNAGLSSDKLARWEKGQAKFNPEEIARLGKALDAATIARAERVEGPLAGSGGKGVRSLRRAYGITQEELARRAEMTQASISLFENGYVALDAEEENEIRAACEELVRERTPSASMQLCSLASLASLASAQPVQRQESAEERLQKEVALLKKILGSSEKMEAFSKEIRANQDEIIEELKAEIARLELLNRETNESKDREIQTLRRRLKAKKTLVTVPPEEILGTEE